LDLSKIRKRPALKESEWGSSVLFLVLYVDDILLIENDVNLLWGVLGIPRGITPPDPPPPPCNTCPFPSKFPLLLPCSKKNRPAFATICSKKHFVYKIQKNIDLTSDLPGTSLQKYYAIGAKPSSLEMSPKDLAGAHLASISPETSSESM
jgi:hypothetical protein